MYFFIPNFHLIPAVRMTQQGKWADPDAQRYIDNQAALSWEYRRIMLDNGWVMLPSNQPLYVKWKVQRRGSLYKADIDNFWKGIIDAAQGIVFENDRFIVLDLGGEKTSSDEEFVEVEFGLVADLSMHTI